MSEVREFVQIGDVTVRPDAILGMHGMHDKGGKEIGTIMVLESGYALHAKGVSQEDILREIDG